MRKHIKQEHVQVFNLGPSNVASVVGVKEDLTSDAECDLLIHSANDSGIIYLFSGDLSVAQCQQRIAQGRVDCIAAVAGAESIEVHIPTGAQKFTLFNDSSGTANNAVAMLRFRAFEYVPLHLHVPAHLQEDKLPRRSPESATVPPTLVGVGEATPREGYGPAHHSIR